jgi:hypothetical protein
MSSGAIERRSAPSQLDLTMPLGLSKRCYLCPLPKRALIRSDIKPHGARTLLLITGPGRAAMLDALFAGVSTYH